MLSAAPITVVVSFIDRINHSDAEGLGSLMTDDHELRIFDEAPVVGRAANVQAWHGYSEAFPEYVICPLRIAEDGDRVAVLGYTLRSHLDLPDEQERQETLIWLAEVVGGALRFWQLLEDTPERRADLGLA